MVCWAVWFGNRKTHFEGYDFGLGLKVRFELRRKLRIRVRSVAGALPSPRKSRPVFWGVNIGFVLGVGLGVSVGYQLSGYALW